MFPPLNQTKSANAEDCETGIPARNPPEDIAGREEDDYLASSPPFRYTDQLFKRVKNEELQRDMVW
jgi:hypothetical protein